jgi:hypothetical protein
MMCFLVGRVRSTARRSSTTGFDTSDSTTSRARLRRLARCENVSCVRCLSLHLKTRMYLPRQARDKRRKSTRKRDRFVSAQAVVGLFMHSDVTPHGNLTISQSTSEGQILGAVHAAVVQTQACNIYSIPTDCPQREKRGWMGMKKTASLCFPTFYSTRYSPYYTLYIVIVLPTQARDKSIYHCSSNHNYH